MEVYYKFRSAKDYDSIPIDWHYTSVSGLTEYILKEKCSGKCNKTNYDKLFLTNADTNEEYLDGQTLIPKNTFLIVRRAPRYFCMPIVINPPTQEDNPLAETKLKEEHVLAKENSFGEPSVSVYPQESEWVEMWNYLSPSEVVVPLNDDPRSNADKDRKIKDLIGSRAFDWQQCRNPTDSFGASRGFERCGMGGRSGGCGFGRGGLSDRLTPPPGYICHRCNVPGHFIQHCPTNDDPTFDIKRTKPPTGIPSSMLVASPDGLYALPGGVAAVFKPNEAAFEKEIQGVPSTRSFADLPAELYCPLCRAVMKDAVLAGKCCFQSFCDKCIREYIMSNSLCICGAKNVLADDLIPNKTVRDTIIWIIESASTKGANGSMKSAPCPKPMVSCSKVPFPTLSAPSKGVIQLAPKSEGNSEVEEITEPVEADNVAQKTLGKVTVGKGVEVFEAAHECLKEPGSQMCPAVTDEEMPQKPISGKVEKKLKKFAEMQLGPHQGFADVPVESSGYNPYWNHTLPYCGQMPFMGYGLAPTSISFGAAFHQNPFAAQVYMMPVPPQRDLAKFDARKTTIKHKRDHEKRGRSREVSRDKDFSRDMIRNEDVTSLKSNFKSITLPDYHQPLLEKLSPECSAHDPELIRTYSKRMVKHNDDYYEEHPHELLKKERLHHQQPELVSATRLPILSDTVDVSPLPSKYETNSDWKHKISVLACIASPEAVSPVYKKRKLGNSSSSVVNRSSHHRSHSTASDVYHENQCNTAAALSKNNYNNTDGHIYEWSDVDRHCKRRASRYSSRGRKGSQQQALVDYLCIN